jgi:hypothetical protein
MFCMCAEAGNRARQKLEGHGHNFGHSGTSQIVSYFALILLEGSTNVTIIVDM